MASERFKLGTGVALAFTRSPLEAALSAEVVRVVRDIIARAHSGELGRIEGYTDN